jgi:hypothetical protein
LRARNYYEKIVNVMSSIGHPETVL